MWLKFFAWNTFAGNHCLKSTTYKHHKIQVIPALWVLPSVAARLTSVTKKHTLLGSESHCFASRKDHYSESIVLHTSGLICYFYSSDNEIIIGYEHHKSMYRTYLVLKVMVAGGAEVCRKFSWHTVDTL